MLRQARLPHRLRQILEGESLFNDASALLIYRMAVAIAMGESVSAAWLAPRLLIVVVGSVAVGWAAARVFHRINRGVEDVPTSIVLQFGATFGVWIVAEHVGLSGILTIVAYAITIARSAPHTTPARIRVPSYAVWETTVFVLNALAFVLIGLQLGPIISDLSPAQLGAYARIALVVLGVVIATRIVWVMLYNTAVRWKIRRFGTTERDSLQRPTARGGLLVSWCGMRGIVTLAAALALPAGGPGADPAFPGRPLILFTAFTVVVGTLIVQGLTLRPLLAWLDLRDDEPVEHEVATARRSALQAALQTLAGNDGEAANALRFELQELLSGGPRGTAGAAGGPLLPALRTRAVAAARAELKRLRFDESIGDDAYHRVEVTLDRSELYAETARG